ncbi:MAG: HEPN domain-containing protein [Alphaproteobacteria bacterium]|nr:HEPN domain-containing protein [Alphaproteobacteria bacterium]
MKPAIESFITLAREDLAVAKLLMAAHPRHSAFHIEQAAEKLVKAVLTAEDIRFPTSHHQLGALAALLPADHPWRAELMAFDEFSSYATASRYPTPGGWMPHEPDPADLRQGWQEVANLIDEIADWCAQP